MELGLRGGTVCSEERCPLFRQGALSHITAEQKHKSKLLWFHVGWFRPWGEQKNEGKQELKDKEVTPVVLSACQEHDGLFGLLAAAYFVNAKKFGNEVSDWFLLTP